MVIKLYSAIFLYTLLCDNVIDSVLSASVSPPPPILIVASYDGFRNEYLQRNVTPNLLKLRQDGVYADYMLNVFPTKTFTNHHSISTGFYPGVHGVLANSVYDSQQGQLNYSYELFHYNMDIQPIWTVNEKAGGVSGCMMWPGANYNYSGISCTYTQAYNSKVPLKNRVDTVMKWLTDPDKPANLIMFYSEQPDKLAHVMGPDSKNITSLVHELDELTKYIQDQLAQHNLSHRANVIHLSDHGMAGVTPPKFINLTEFASADSFSMYGTSPILQIVPIKGKEFVVYDKLQKGSQINGHFEIYNSSNALERWHTYNIRRFGPILAVAKEGYAFQDMWDAARSYNKSFNIPITNTTQYGVHGYDNEMELMHPIFMAKGPLFKSAHKTEPFESVDLFNLFIKMLNISGEPSRNGSLARVQDVLDFQSSPSSLTKTAILMLVALCLVILAVMIYAVLYYRKRRNYNITHN